MAGHPPPRRAPDGRLPHRPPGSGNRPGRPARLHRGRRRAAHRLERHRAAERAAAARVHRGPGAHRVAGPRPVGVHGRGDARARQGRRARRARPGARPAVRPGREPGWRAVLRHRDGADRAAGYRAPARAAHRRRTRQDRRQPRPRPRQERGKKERSPQERLQPVPGHHRPRGDARRGGQARPAPRPDRGRLRLHRRRRLGPVAAAPGAAPRGRRPAHHRHRRRRAPRRRTGRHRGRRDRGAARRRLQRSAAARPAPGRGGGAGHPPGRRDEPGRRAPAPHRHRRRPGHRAHRGRREHPAQARMSFADPVLGAVGLLLAAGLAWAAVAAGRRRAAALAAAGITAGAPGTGKGRGRSAGIWFTIAGLAVLAVAVAGPSATVPVSRASGTVILAMDVSGSMAATDVAPSRLAAAKRAALSFIGAQPDSVDIGVVAFTQGGLEAALPTPDHTTAEAAVRRLKASGGTSLGDAILASLSAITHKTVVLRRDGSAPDIGYWPSATIVLFSDGQDEGGATGGTSSSTSTNPAAAVAEKAGVHIDTVGVGTAAGTTVDVDGYHLFTALNAAALRSIAQTTAGAYHPASDAGQLNGIASSIDLRLTTTHEPLPLAGAFIGLALVLLAVGAVLTVTRSGRVV